MTKSNVGGTTFRDFAALGYTRLVPIIPPDAEISENSSLLKRKDARGKAVGVRGRDGKWFGFDWLPHEASEDDYDRWQNMGAGVGIKTGGPLILIDADTQDEDLAKLIRDVVAKHCGALPARVGRYPKVGYPVRVASPVQYCRVEFGERNERGELKDRVEILSEGRQFVAHGIHPVTREPYYWPRDLVPLNELPQISELTLRAMMTEFESVLPAARPLITEGSTTVVNQDALKRDLALVRKAVEAIPNTSKNFATRESYRDFGYAIKAALPDHQHEAFDLYSDWCARWKDGENDPDIVEADWRRMKPPFRRGAGWLFELAEQFAAEKFNRGEVWFEPIVQRESIFSEEAASTKARTLELISFQDAASTALQIPAKALIKGMLDQGAFSVIYGESNVGKTFVAMDIACAIATGRRWGCLRTTKSGVLYVAAEGGLGTRKRCAALLRKFPEAQDDANFHLRLANINLLRADQDLTPLIETIRQFGGAIRLVVIDTLSRAMAGGDENASTDMGALVRNFDRIRQATNAHVMVVHHSGKDKAKGARGHSLLRAATDTEIEVSDQQINVTKQRDIDKSFSSAFVLHQIELGKDVDGDPITSATIELVGKGALPAGKPTLAEAAVLEALRSLEGVGGRGKGVSFAEVAAAMRAVGNLKAAPDTVRKQLMALEKKRRVSKKSRGRWCLVEPKPDYSEYFEPVSGRE